jgi:RimJ/RimL family protein N-acetyltransferase
LLFALNRPLALKPGTQESILLRGAVIEDASHLREWKNAQRQFFFFNEEISEGMQTRWMSAYFERPDDYMFIVEQNGRAVGCVGLRFDEGRGDIYNVILGDPALRGGGIMSLALRAVLTFGRKHSENIGLKVLKTNPAVGFYARNGLSQVAERDNYYEMKVDWQRFEPVAIE